MAKPLRSKATSPDALGAVLYQVTTSAASARNAEAPATPSGITISHFQCIFKNSLFKIEKFQKILEMMEKRFVVKCWSCIYGLYALQCQIHELCSGMVGGRLVPGTSSTVFQKKCIILSVTIFKKFSRHSVILKEGLRQSSSDSIFTNSTARQAVVRSLFRVLLKSS